MLLLGAIDIKNADTKQSLTYVMRKNIVIIHLAMPLDFPTLLLICQP